MKKTQLKTLIEAVVQEVDSIEKEQKKVLPPATMRKNKIQIERVRSGFMGFPLITIVWADGKVIAWSTNDYTQIQ